MRGRRPPSSRTAVLALALLAMPAASAIAGEDHFVNAVGTCMAARPEDDGSLRRRPTGLENAGPGDVFVSCSLPGSLGFDVYGALVVYFRSAAASDAPAPTCTLVNGSVLTDPPRYFTRQAEPFSNGFSLVAFWPSDLRPHDTAFAFSWLNLSCRLAPDVELAMVGAMAAPDPSAAGLRPRSSFHPDPGSFRSPR